MQKKLSSVLYITLIVVLTSAFIIQGAGIFINAYDEHLTGAQYQAEAICKEFDNELNSYLDISLNIITNPLIIELLQFGEELKKLRIICPTRCVYMQTVTFR